MHANTSIRSRKNLFVTGRPGVGKTTLIRSVLTELGARVGGFYTVEVRKEGHRIGFDIVSTDGERGVLARHDLPSPHRVARYGVNREDLERIGVPAIERAVGESELIVMDEIGRMELCSERFQRAVIVALDSEVPVLGTIQDRRNSFLDAVRDRGDVRMVTVTEFNRDDLVVSIAADARRLVDEWVKRRNARQLDARAAEEGPE